MKIYIGGGTGFIGSRLSKCLQNKAHEVVPISRSSGKGKITWTDVEKIGLPEKCDAVVNLAGENLMNPLRRWNAAFRSDLEASRVHTNKLLAKAIASASKKPEVFVTASAVGYYRPSQTAEYTEESPGGDFDYLSRLCTDWEQAAKLVADINVRQAVVRIGLALGREGGIIKTMYVPFFLGLGGNVGAGQQWFPWIHVDDIAGIFVHVLENKKVSGVFNAVSPELATNADFTKKFAAAMRRPAFLPVPELALNLIYGEERAKAMVEGQKVLPQKTLRSGYKFSYPDLQSAVNDCVK
ncbi:hypothetical protein LSH36_69g01031 [Paralvinella palmiformis]|uniref:TIGR01777 family protein n=1 Tax=Paralvinella palmiformis TaxID=53620 RepID=A0AAD9K4N5_9ANNE|nr:hypothetical protein LSH36_69g01031 [Paralvinella palmiformis]